MLFDKKSDALDGWTPDGWTIVSLEGALDFNQSVSVLKRLRENVTQGSVLADLSSVSHIDSAGIACLVETYRTAANNGLRFELSGVGPNVMRILTLFRLDTVLPIHQTSDRAPSCSEDKHVPAPHHRSNEQPLALRRSAGTGSCR